jgi:hypothetical protein
MALSHGKSTRDRRTTIFNSRQSDTYLGASEDRSLHKKNVTALLLVKEGQRKNHHNQQIQVKKQETAAQAKR